MYCFPPLSGFSSQKSYQDTKDFLVGLHLFTIVLRRKKENVKLYLTMIITEIKVEIYNSGEQNLKDLISFTENAY